MNTGNGNSSIKCAAMSEGDYLINKILNIMLHLLSLDANSMVISYWQILDYVFAKLIYFHLVSEYRQTTALVT